jgi:hypothetical protein
MPTLAAELEVVEQVHHELDLPLKQIATVVGADESTLHRWLSGTTPNGPRRVYMERLAALAEFRTELRDAFRSDHARRRWVAESHPPQFGGRTPLEMLLAGRLERVTALLWSLNNGMPT